MKSATKLGEAELPDETALTQFQPIVIVMNVVALAATWLTHLAYEPYIPRFQGGVVGWVLIIRILEQIGEYVYLGRTRQNPSTFQQKVYPHLAIGINLAFAVLLSLISNTDEAHYLVLFAIPVVSAAFCYSIWGVLAVSAVAVGFLFVDLWAYSIIHPTAFPTHRPMEHRFELMTMGIILPVLGVFVWRLVENLRSDQVALRSSFEKLRKTQWLLDQEERLADVGRLSSVIAHEIRNPVSTIVHAVQLADRKVEKNESPSEFYELARSEAKRLETLTNDLLLFAKPLTLKAQKHSAKNVLEYVAEVLRANHDAIHTTIQLHSEADLESEFDTHHIQRALLNLALNAAAHSSIGAPVVLGTEKRDDEFQFFVENHGEPIPHDLITQIFEPFFSTRSGGTGLGLPICQKIAELHGGNLALAINEPGRIRFTISIPHRAVRAAVHV